jgi:hypothetical protein
MKIKGSLKIGYKKRKRCLTIFYWVSGFSFLLSIIGRNEMDKAK